MSRFQPMFSHFDFPAGSRLRKVLMSCCRLAFLLVISAPALAQGTSGSFPDPISTRELERYCDRLNMSDQQRQGIGLNHDQYLEAFRVLRDGLIEEFLDENGAGAGFSLNFRADRKDLEKTARKREDLFNRIRSLDNRFFDQIQTVLTDDQLAHMSRVKQARQRVRHRSGLTRMAGAMNPGASVDLSELYDDLNLLLKDVTTTDPILWQYERNLTVAVRELFEKSSRLQIDIQKNMEAEGFDGNSPPSSRDDRESYVGAIMMAFNNLNARLSELSAKISELNNRNLNVIAQMLPRDAAWQFRNEYYDRAYPNLPSGRGAAGRRFDIIEKMKEITVAQRQEIDEAETLFLDELGRLTKRMVEHVDNNRPQRGGMMVRFTSSGEDEEVEKEREKYESKLDEMRERRTRLIDQTVVRLSAILGEEMTQHLDRRIAATEPDAVEVQEGAVEIFAISVAGGGGGDFQMLNFRSIGNLATLEENDEEESSDQYIPGPISRRDLKKYARYLKVGEDQASIIDSLHDDYMESFRLLQDTQIKAIRDRERNLWSLDSEDGDISIPSKSDIENLYRLRRSVLRSIEALDESFLNDLETVVLNETGTTAMQRVKLARKRSIYMRVRDTGGFRMFGGGGGRRVMSFIGLGGDSSGESVVDLSGLVDELALGDAELAKTDPILNDYEQTITSQFQKAFESSMRMDEAMDGIRAESMTVSGNGRRRQVNISAGGMRNAMQTDGRTSREARKAIVELNRITLQKLAQVLPSESMDRLRDVYNRRSFPDIFNDPKSARHIIDAVLAQEDLTPAQRMAVQEIAMDYRSRYQELSNQMVDLKISQPVPGNDDNFGRINFQAMQQQQRGMEKIRFDRNDLSDKTRNQIRNALSEEIRERLRELFEQKEPESGAFHIGG